MNFPYFSLLALFSGLLITFPAFAETPSLLFTEEELTSIDKEMHKEPSPDDRDAITLGAVLYYSPKSWTIWIRGKKWTPETRDPNLHILDVTPERVRLSIASQEGAAPIHIALHPYQTYHLSTGQMTGDNE